MTATRMIGRPFYHMLVSHVSYSKNILVLWSTGLERSTQRRNLTVSVVNWNTHFSLAVSCEICRHFHQTTILFNL